MPFMPAAAEEGITADKVVPFDEATEDIRAENPVLKG